VKQRGDFERCGASHPEHVREIRHREPGIDDVFHDEQVASFDRPSEVVRQLDDAGRLRAGPVTPDPEEVDLARNVDLRSLNAKITPVPLPVG
jgi:hypothetical protein